MKTHFWAVFESVSSGSRDIADFDCIATTVTESEAIKIQMDNPGSRVRKLITVTDSQPLN